MTMRLEQDGEGDLYYVEPSLDGSNGQDDEDNNEPLVCEPIDNEEITLEPNLVSEAESQLCPQRERNPLERLNLATGRSYFQKKCSLKNRSKKKGILKKGKHHEGCKAQRSGKDNVRSSSDSLERSKLLSSSG